MKCPPLNLLQPLSSRPKPNILIFTPAISTSSSSTQAELLLSISSKAAKVLEPEPPIPMSNDVLSNMFTPIESSSIVSTSLSNDIQPPSTSNNVRDSKLNSKTRIRKRKKELLKKLNEEKIEIKMAPYRRKKPAPTDYTTDEEDLITYDVEEELEPDPTDKFAIMEYHKNNPDKYIRALTPTRFRKTNGIGHLHIIDGTLNVRKYIDTILESKLLPPIRDPVTNNASFIFQQDSAPCPTVKERTNTAESSSDDESVAEQRTKREGVDTESVHNVMPSAGK
ncbi:glycerol-3-phosphate dehydrogenase [Trichonephila clavipes]|nr:glycerol-3-phosphate dehydrogenase [Trichonephila clavipes]